MRIGRVFGLSSICNLLSAIQTSKKLGLGADDVIATVATDGWELYESEMAKTRERLFPGGIDTKAAAAAITEHLDGAGTEHTLVLSETDRNRIFNLGYYTWVEQQASPRASSTRVAARSSGRSCARRLSPGTSASPTSTRRPESGRRVSGVSLTPS